MNENDFEDIGQLEAVYPKLNIVPNGKDIKNSLINQNKDIFKADTNKFYLRDKDEVLNKNISNNFRKRGKDEKIRHDNNINNQDKEFNKHKKNKHNNGKIKSVLKDSQQNSFSNGVIKPDFKDFESIRSNPKFLEFRRQLPIYKSRSLIINKVKQNLVTIIVSETGSGKSTQIPQYLLEAGLIGSNKGGVVISQPRRIACITLAERVSQEIGCSLGYKVGYSVRFDLKATKDTLIKFSTDGMLLRELIIDPILSSYSYIVLDEAHERTVRNDALLGRLKAILKHRNEVLKNPLHLIVMSATLDAEKFSIYFNNAPIVRVPGRGHRVEILNSVSILPDFIDAAVKAVIQIHYLVRPKVDYRKENILVFLPGQEEIENCQTLIERILNMENSPLGFNNLKVYPLYSGLPAAQQVLALEPLEDLSCRKCILATNIAETSLTIPGIKYVIDTGVAKYRGYQASTGIETLHTLPISKSGAAQRAGRAGREGPGICYRLYPLSEEQKLAFSDIPEILRCNLDSSLLQLMASGVENIFTFDFIDRPSPQSLQRSMANLYTLGALDGSLKLTEEGKNMVKFPLDPRFAKVLLASGKFGCTKEILLIISALSVDSLMYNPSNKREIANESRTKFINPRSDHLTYLNILRGFMREKGDRKTWCNDYFLSYKNLCQAIEIHDQLKAICEKNEIDPKASTKEEEMIFKCLLQGCFMNTATLHSKNIYRAHGHNQDLKIHPSSVMINNNCSTLIFNEIVETTNTYLRGVSAIERHWVLEAAPRVTSRLNAGLHL